MAQNGGIVVVEADRRNFGYWQVVPAVQPGTHVPLHSLLGHIAIQPEDWGHVHFAESSHSPDGITYWNPLRAVALTPFFDNGAQVIDEIITSLPPNRLHGFAACRATRAGVWPVDLDWCVVMGFDREVEEAVRSRGNRASELRALRMSIRRAGMSLTDPSQPCSPADAGRVLSRLATCSSL